MEFVMMSDRTVPSDLGHVIEFKKGVPTHVPPALHALVRERGAMPVDEIDEPEDQKPADDEPTDPQERLDALLIVIDDMVKLNKRDDFTAAGMPDAAVLTKKLGWRVDAKERNAAWAAYKKQQEGG